MLRRSLSAYEKFLLAQTSDNQNDDVAREAEDEGKEQTEAANKSPAAEEEKRLNEPTRLTVSTSSSASPSLTTPPALTVRQHDPDERKESAVATTISQQQRQQEKDEEEGEDDEGDEEDAAEDGDAASELEDDVEASHSDEQADGEPDDHPLFQASEAQSERERDDSDGPYAGAGELGLLDDVDALPIELLSPLPAEQDEENEQVDAEEEPVLLQDEDEEGEWAADTLSPLPQHDEQQDDNDAATQHQSEDESEASEMSVDGELDDKIHAHKAALSHYTVQPQPDVLSHTATAAPAAEDVNLLSTVREGNEDDEHSNRTLSSTATPTVTAHRWFTDLVNRPSFLSPNSPTAPPSRFSLSSSSSRHSTPNERPSHSHKRSSLPSPLPSPLPSSAASTSLHSSFHHPEYNSPSAFFAAKSGQLGSLSGSRSNRPSFSTPYEAPAASELGSPAAVGRLSFTPFKRNGGREEEQRLAGRDDREERCGLEQDEDEKNINRSLVFHSPQRTQPSPGSRPTHRSSLPPRPPSTYSHAPSTPRKATAATACPANLHLLPSVNLRHCHLFLHFYSTLPHSTLLPLVASTLRHHIPAAALYSSLTNKGSGRWVMMCVLEGEGGWMDERAGWCGGVESVLVGYGMSGLDFVVLQPSTATAS